MRETTRIRKQLMYSTKYYKEIINAFEMKNLDEMLFHKEKLEDHIEDLNECLANIRQLETKIKFKKIKRL